ncbi:MAG: LamG domain-containing protein, partial [Planctomycetota bacterium]
AYYAGTTGTAGSNFDTTFNKLLTGPGVLALWHLDEGAGGTALDASSRGIHGQLAGFSPPFGWQSHDGGQWAAERGVRFSSGSALRFDGVDDVVECGSMSGFGPLTAFSVEGWVRGDRRTVDGSERVLMGAWQPRADFQTGWAAHQPAGARGGYAGAVFDGRYLYFVPHHDGLVHHGEVLRYDTTSPFGANGDWEVFDTGTLPGGTDLAGFTGGAFDGRFIYFANRVGSKVLRLDTQGAFTDAASWTAYAPGDHGVGFDPTGFFGAVFDGRYVYFIPFENQSGYHCEVLRLDTQAPFTSPAAWEAYDPAREGVNPSSNSTRGYAGAVFDGRYIYFVPLTAATFGGQHGEVLRYDTHADFRSLSSWTPFDPGALVSGSDWDGFVGAAFDGRYIYFVPYYNGTSYHREVLRYDTRRVFSTVASWAAYAPNAGSSGAVGYSGAVFDGRYVTFVPRYNGLETHGEALRYDTLAPFASDASWTVHDPGDDALGYALNGFLGGVSDGRYIYFVPENNAEIARFDAMGGGGLRLVWGLPAQDGGLAGAPFGIAGTVTTTAGTFTAASNRLLSPGEWHHVVLTYDGSALALYIDGVLLRSRSATGAVDAAGMPLRIGAVGGGKGHFAGTVDEVGFWGRALSPGEVRAHFERRKHANPEPRVIGIGEEEKK